MGFTTVGHGGPGMVWVKSEYADELAVLVTWLTMVVPWSVTYHSDGPLSSHLAFVRISVFELQLRFPSEITIQYPDRAEQLEVMNALDAVYSGSRLFENFYGTTPPTAALWYDGVAFETARALTLANAFWTLAALLLLAAFALSIAMYTREDATRERLPLPYPRLTGWLLVAATVPLTVSTAWFYIARDTVGIPIPVGLVVILVLAVLLIRAETVEDAPDEAADPA